MKYAMLQKEIRKVMVEVMPSSGVTRSCTPTDVLCHALKQCHGRRVAVSSTHRERLVSVSDLDLHLATRIFSGAILVTHVLRPQGRATHCGVKDFPGSANICSNDVIHIYTILPLLFHMP